MKTRVAVLYGGKSAEHEISQLSAANVIGMLNPELFEVVPIEIDKTGRWTFEGALIHLTPGAARPLSTADGALAVDVVFPVLHGPYGEDGSVQGVLEVLGLPYVGAGVLGAAVGMDKEVMKRLLTQANIANAPSVTVRRHQREQHSWDAVREVLGSPVFVKPANLGSSVGVHKVRTAAEFDAALDDALSWDSKVIVEAMIDGREVECAVLGNEAPRASIIGEIVTQSGHDFYSYDAKYIDESGAQLNIPAVMDDTIAQRVREVSVRVYEVLECAGLARVDSFLTPDGDIFVNEINTLPGFTNISMYPKLWEATGVPQDELVAQLIQHALDRHAQQAAMRTSR